MKRRDAIAMLSSAELQRLEPGAWADLGCGDGTFTLALAELLPPGSLIHAMDRDASSLARIPPRHQDVRIFTHAGDFTRLPWPFTDLMGILMANSLHFVADQPAFLRMCGAHMRAPHRFLIVEYDTSNANPWVPYPVTRSHLHSLLPDYTMTELGSRPSRYQRAELYAALCVVDARGTPPKEK